MIHIIKAPAICTIYLIQYYMFDWIKVDVVDIYFNRKIYTVRQLFAENIIFQILYRKVHTFCVLNIDYRCNLQRNWRKNHIKYLYINIQL